MERPAGKPSVHEGLAPAVDGVGPLLRRDYWATIDRSRLGPPDIKALLAQRFASFAPKELVEFERRPLQLGVTIGVHIRASGRSAVRVIHEDAQSLTLATLPGHPEAGRITFGAYRNGQGNVIFHIRSHARSGSRLMYMGYLSAGDPMQTNTWTDFVGSVAVTAGEGVLGEITVKTTTIEEEPEDLMLHQPTYFAQGG